MKISAILDHIDSGHVALPEFQRGYVWNREQVRGLFQSLYRRHPVGGLLVWATESLGASHRGGTALAPGVVKLLLDGQQRITSLYGVVRGRPPKFFDGDTRPFTGLHFHLEEETFEFYQPVKMRDDRLWVDVSVLMAKGNAGMGEFVSMLSSDPVAATRLGDYLTRLGRLRDIIDIDLHVEEITGVDKTLDVVVDIFNRVNSGGTKLSKGDLALAKICADWPEGRREMKKHLEEWARHGFEFTLDWLLRSVNTILTGEARFQFLHDRGADEVRDALRRAAEHIDTILNHISSRLGLDHDRVFFGRFAVPVMVRYLEVRSTHTSTPMDHRERDKLLFWYAQAAMWGRFSGSTESMIDQDLAALESPDGGLDALLDQLRLWHGGLRTEAGHFAGFNRGARFYPVLYMMTRLAGARDFGDGNALNANMLGKGSRLEVHHIFPKAQLAKAKVRREEVNAIANFCFLTKTTNLQIRDRLPEEYLPKVEEAQPGVLASQWIPMDPALWRVERYRDFLEARKALLADALNTMMTSLLHGDDRWMTGAPAAVAVAAPFERTASEDEDAELAELNEWMAEKGLPLGVLGHEITEAETGDALATLDIAWPQGVQEELSAPVALLLNEGAELIALANQSGFRCFVSTADFREYVERDILAGLQ